MCEQAEKCVDFKEHSGQSTDLNSIYAIIKVMNDLPRCMVPARLKDQEKFTTQIKNKISGCFLNLFAYLTTDAVMWFVVLNQQRLCRFLEKSIGNKQSTRRVGKAKSIGSTDIPSSSTWEVKTVGN